MIKQYCRVALRNLGRQKALALINVLGLSVGLTCFIVFLLYAVNESGYDRFHSRAADIYRVDEWAKGSADREPGGIAGLSMGLGPALAHDFPDVEHIVRFRSRGDRLVKVGGQLSRQTVSFADPSFFSVFSFPLLSGSAVHALEGAHSVVLTRDMARQLFGAENVMGKIVQIKIDSAYESFLITGVAENLPSNTLFDFGFLIGYASAEAHSDPRALSDWYETMGDETFVLLRHGSTLGTDLNRMIAFRERHLPGEAPDWIKNKQWDGKGIPPFTYRLQPLRDIHTNPSIDGSGNPVDPKHIWLLIGMAAAVLLIACINFTTLSIGRSAGRAKEIGVRKVIGSKRRQLVYQFLAESLALSFISGLLALALAGLLLPYVSGLTGTPLHLSFRQFPQLGWMLGALVLFTGLLAGAYPALVLSGFKPLEVLKSKVRLNGSNLFTRSLVVLQFVLSAGLVTVTLVALRQVSFMRSKDLGFQKENIIDVNASGLEDARVFPLFRQLIQADPQVKGITSAEIGMGDGNGFMGSGYSYHGKGGGSLEYPVEPGYIPVMGMQLLEGRDFDPRISADSTGSVIVNQTLLEEFHIPPALALGQTLVKVNDLNVPVSYTIIGVVKDFNFTSLSQKVRPQLFFWPSGLRTNHIYVRVNPGDPSRILSHLGRVWKSLVPGLPFQYHFQDEEMNRMYESETRWSRVIGLAGGIAVCLACLGLFGLAALVAVNRNKEIGIRKVLGASVSSLVRLLSLEFSRLVLIALALSTPLAWYFSLRWLQGYAYRTSLEWWIFALTGALTLALAVATVSFHALRAAWSNPVESLKAE
jgi:putative ABC transport system permease protein